MGLRVSKAARALASVAATLCFAAPAAHAAISFAPASQYGCDACVRMLAVADLGGVSGRALVAPAGASGIAVLPGHADGTFSATPTYYATDGSAGAIAIGDFNGDGKPDVAAAITSAPKVEVLLNRGDGTLGAPITSALPTGCDPPGPIGTGDFNNDGAADLGIGAECDLTGNGTAYCCAALAVMLGAGNGSLSPAAGGSKCQPTTGPPACYNDGGIYGGVWGVFPTRLGGSQTDVVTSDASCGFDGGVITVFKGAGDGSFDSGTNSPVACPSLELAIADLNGDSTPDVFTTGTTNFGACFNGGDCADLTYLAGGGDALGAPAFTMTDHVTPKPPVLADIDGDGEQDAVTPECCNGGDALQVYAGLGGGSFGPVQSFPGLATGAGQPYYTATGDFNGDGRPDVATLNGGGVTVYLNTTPYPGSATCAPASSVVCDGGFEDPVINGPYATYTAGGHFGPWVVDSGSVDIEGGSDVAAAEGSQSLDLNGTGPGGVHQDVATSAGTTYALQFSYAANPTCGSQAAHLGVLWNGSPVAQIDVSSDGHTKASPGWQQSQQYSVTATGSSSRLSFASGGPSDPCGPMVDAIAATPGAGSGGGGGGSCLVRTIPHSNEPVLAVVVVDGVGTSTPNDSFIPVDSAAGDKSKYAAVDSYCYPYKASFGSFPPSVRGAIGGYYGTLSPAPSLGSEILTDQLAMQGAVMLPYSYQGAYFSSCPRGNGAAPVFHVTYSSSSDPGNTDMNRQAGLLYGEIQSIHACWPDTPIDVLADSGGGVPSEYYWNTAFQSERDGVRHIFTLDSPINGLDHTFLESIVDNHLGPVVRDFYGKLWDNLEPSNRRELALDGDGSFRPIGTIGDYAFELGDLRWVNFGGSDAPALQALLSQVLMSCGGFITDTCSVVEPPDYVSPCSGSDYHGDASHELVRICKPTVEYIKALTAQDIASGPRVATRAQGTPARAVSPTGLPAAGPTVAALLVAAAPGQAVTIRGAGFGSAPGTVSFAGGVAGHVVSWSDGSVVVTVPNARSGPILLRTAGGETVLASALAVLHGGRVARLRVRASHGAAAGRSQAVRVTALAAGGRPAAGVPISLFDGAVERTVRADRRGAATFAVAGFGTQVFLVHAGRASAPVRLRWKRASGRLFSSIALTVLSARGAAGGRVSIGLQVGGAGRLTYSARAAGRQFARRSLAVAGRGRRTVTLTPSGAALRRLARRTRVTVSITFRPASHAAAVRRRVTVTVRR